MPSPEPPVPSLAPRYIPSETAERFILAAASGDPAELRFLLLTGPRGEGKTSAALEACSAVAERLRQARRAAVLPVQVAVVRDTWANLQRTTLVSFEESRAKGLPIRILDGGHRAILGTPAEVVFWFFGLDRAEDADKLQGFACGILWLEEVAPAAGLAAGVPQEALGIGVTCLRQPGVPKRVFVTMNPPDDDHWILHVEEFLAGVGLTDFRVWRFAFPPGEKSRHFERLAAQARDADEGRAWAESAKEFDNYRTRNKAFLESIGRGDLVSRLVEGRVAGVQVGEPVVPEFSDLHIAQAPMPLLPGSPLIRAWDAGLCPSTVALQVTPSGNVNVLWSKTSLNKGMAQHVLEEVLPWMGTVGLTRRIGEEAGQFGRGPGRAWEFRDLGDPSCLTPDQSNSEQTVARVLEGMLGAAFEPGPVAWSARREALHAAFTRKGTGDRMFVMLDREGNRDLIKALRGRAHYPVDPATGRVTPTVEAAKRASGIWFSSLDSLAYALAVVAPAEEWLRKQPPVPKSRRAIPPAKSWLGA